MSRSRSLAVTLVLLLTAIGVAGCGSSHAGFADKRPSSSRFVYDSVGRLAAVQEGGTTAVYRYDEAGDRVAVDRVRSRDFDPAALRPRARPAPEVTGITPGKVAQGATITVSGKGFDGDPMGNVVAVGGALGRVLSAEPGELRVQLPPVAVPGPVTVSTAYGRSTSRHDLVVVPAEVDPAEVGNVVDASVGRTATLRAPRLGSDSGRRTMLTFRGTAGSTVQLRLTPAHDPGDGEDACGSTEVGLAGPTGTIIESSAGDASWCGRPARLPMTGTYTATVTQSRDLRATLTVTEGTAAKQAETRAETPTEEPDAPGTPLQDGPPDFPVELASGSLVTQVTDLDLGGSGAADVTRSFSVGDQDLPALAPEEPLARRWSIGASLALEPSVSYSYLDIVLPDGRRLPCRRVSAGAPSRTGAVFEPSGGVGAGPFAGSRVEYTGSGWELRTRANAVLGFARSGSPLRLSWLRDPAGRTARFIRAPESDGSPGGDLLGVVSEDGQWARFTHDSEHRIASVTDQVGDSVSYRYARIARVYADLLVAATYRPTGAGSTTEGYRYQALTGRLAAVTDGRGDRILFRYDAAGRVVSQTELASPGTRARVWRYSYAIGKSRVSIPGRTDSVTLPRVRSVTVTGPAGRRTVTFPAARKASQPPDSLSHDDGGPASGQAAADLGTSGGLRAGYLEVTDNGKPHRDPPAIFVDAKGRWVASHTTDVAVSRIGYDSYDRPVSISDPDGATTRLTYTGSGDIASVSDPAGTTRYGWNDRGQQVSETDPLGARQQWRYDQEGRLVWSQDARGVVSTFGYDGAGRLTAALYGVRHGKPPASRIDHVYDRAGRLRQVRDSAADGPVRFRYDERGNLVAEITPEGTLRREYDAAGRRTGVSLPGAVSVHYAYTPEGRATGLDLRARSGSVHVAPRLDRAGRLVGLDLPDGVRGRFAYADGQLEGLSYTRGGRRLATQQVGHDEAGRLSSLDGDLSRPALPGDQPATAFDAAHQVTKQETDGGAGQPWRWDRAGNLLRDDSHEYSWDVRGRLVAMVGPAGRTTFGYDALGRRTSATTAGQTVRYVYDGDDVVQYVADDGTRTTYLRGPDGTPWASLSDAGTTTYLPDALGNVGAAVDGDGTTRRFSYDPFGVPGSRSQRAEEPGFRGLLADPSGQVPMGARAYAPATGRFLSRDSWGIEGGDTNLYRYALGAPTVFTDPSGHASECVGIALGWAMSVLGPGGGWDDFDAIEDQAATGQISQDEWSVRADKVSHDIWSGFDVVANVCGTSAIGTSAAALPLLGSSKVASRLLGGLADDAVTGAAATRVGRGIGRLEPGVSARARQVLDRLVRSQELVVRTQSGGIIRAKFAQRTFSESFGLDGALKGRTIDGVAKSLRSGAMSIEDVPVNVIFREGNMLITNTRSAQALTRAGIPRDLWKVVDQTGHPLFERLLSRQLRVNRLDSSGVDLP